MSESDFSTLLGHAPDHPGLARMWADRDPMPARLPDSMLVALAMDELEGEYELLHVVERTRELAGTRGQTEALTIVFSGVSVWLMMQVRTLSATERRLDGWISPARRLQVTVRQEDATWESKADPQGRFELPRLRTGLSRVVLEDFDTPALTPEIDEVAALTDEEPLKFATPAFEL